MILIRVVVIVDYILIAHTKSVQFVLIGEEKMVDVDVVFRCFVCGRRFDVDNVSFLRGGLYICKFCNGGRGGEV